METPAAEQQEEVWEGTFTYNWTGPQRPACDTRYTVSFTVRDTQVSGDITLVTSSCPGANPGDSITGTKDGPTMTLAFFGGSVGNFAITDGNRIFATFSSVPEEQRVLDVRCVNCTQ